MAAGTIGLFFFRFWRKSGDRLFACFAVGFWILAGNWAALAFVSRDEPQTALYTVRFAAYCFILLGIIEKNRGSARHAPAPEQRPASPPAP